MSHPTSADVFLAGVGAVGLAFLDRLTRLGDHAPRLVGACTTRGTVYDSAGLDPCRVAHGDAWDEATDWDRLLDRLETAAQGPRPVVFVDATCSPDVGRTYLRLLEAGVRVATPSKHANTAEQAYFDALQSASAGGATYRYETTVGAGLPVVETVRDLRASGDRLLEATCCASGTLTFVFDRVAQGDAFSAAVLEARARGYAEPDVRADLSGEDVARKLVILARTAGYQVERADMAVEPLVPADFADLPADEVPGHLAACDAAWSRRAAGARARGHVLRYVGRLSGGSLAVGVQEVPAASRLGRLCGTDNLFEFRTERYGAGLIAISGPGAGADVTAGGVLADVLKVAAAPAAMPVL